MARRVAQDLPRRIIDAVSNRDDLRWLYPEKDSEQTRVMPQSEIPDDAAAPEWVTPSSEPGPDQRPTAPPNAYPPSTYPQQQYVQPGYAPIGPYQQPAPPQPRQRRRRKKRRILKLFVLLFVLWVLYLATVPVIAYMTTSTVAGASSSLEDQPGTAVLLVGSDGREDLSPEDRRRLGTGSTQGGRTDTMMLLYTAPNGKSVLMGFPRDSYVKIPGHGKNKLNAAYAFGGAPLLIETIESNTGIKIDGYLEVGMLGLVDVVDAVGGIEICPKKAIKDRDSHLDIPGGCQNADGVTALNYARMRKADKRGDLGRMERQREVIGQIMKEATSPLTFINPVRYWNINMGAAHSITRTDETGIGTAAAAGFGLVSGRLGNGVTLTVPIADAGARTSAGSSVLWDKKKSSAVFDAIARGDVDAVAEYQ